MEISDIFETLLYGFFRCDHCRRPHPNMKRKWISASFPAHEFGSKKCMIGFERKNKQKMQIKHKRGNHMNKYYPAPGSKGKYLGLWKSNIPKIIRIIENNSLSQCIKLSRDEFIKVGERKSYSFNLEFLYGNVVNNISGSAVARDLASELTRNIIIKTALETGHYKFKMGNDFIFWISQAE